MHAILESADAGYVVGEVIAFVILFVLLAVVLGIGALVLSFFWRLAFGPRRPLPPRPPSPPDDWDDEEYIARHHH
jgi:Na+-transporting methylmalonyl-CoA/oxaloacetate decarboxylase gamma subunit